MPNYFYLLGMDCAPHLRRQLDCGLRILDHPTEEEYAQFEPRYDGNCPMRMKDGRCSLHAELGEEILPDVCRLYPRGIRLTDGIYECSCANSCEAVPELFLHRESPITFIKRKMAIQLPPLPSRSTLFETLGMEQPIRLYLISVMQDRRMSPVQRLLCLGEILDRIDQAFTSKDKTMLDSVLQSRPTPPVAEKKEINEAHVCFGLNIVEQMIEILDARSQSIRGCGEAALAYFGKGEAVITRYHTARARFEIAFPQWEIFYEHMLVNHMFFSQFPFQDRPESMHSEYIALCALYAVLRFLGLGCMAERSEESTLVDGMAAAFRLVEHTEFDRYASHILKRLHCTSREELLDLISL